MKTGDVVMLRSGGPLMTVVRRKGGKKSGTAWCMWLHDGDAAPHEGEFPLVALVRADPATGRHAAADCLRFREPQIGLLTEGSLP